MFALALAAVLAVPAADPKLETPKADPFVFAEGDRVVLLGSTLIEREQKYGHWELALTLKNPSKAVTFRNLGWSGDTVFCESRGSFDGPSKGFQRTVSLVTELKPTVIIICYGHNESFDGEAGVKKFTDGLTKLINAVTPTKARIVLMSPTPFEQTQPLIDAKAKNANLLLYIDAMKGVAEAKKLGFFDLYTAVLTGLGPNSNLETRTENGLHLSSKGYKSISELFLGTQAPSSSDLTSLREKIVEKNQLFFYRWRPQNETYLFGFRRGEQGKNGKEIPEFDPLIAAVEKEINALVKKLTG